MISKMKIRKGNLKDSKELYSLLNDNYELRGDSEGEAYSKNWIKEVVSDKKRNLVLIAEENEKIIGFLIAHILPDKDYFLNDIYVKPEYRLKGVGSKLFYYYDKLASFPRSKLNISFTMTSNKKMHNLLNNIIIRKVTPFTIITRRENEPDN